MPSHTSFYSENGQGQLEPIGFESKAIDAKLVSQYVMAIPFYVWIPPNSEFILMDIDLYSESAGVPTIWRYGLWYVDPFMSPPSTTPYTTSKHFTFQDIPYPFDLWSVTPIVPNPLTTPPIAIFGTKKTRKWLKPSNPLAYYNNIGNVNGKFAFFSENIADQMGVLIPSPVLDTYIRMKVKTVIRNV